MKVNTNTEYFKRQALEDSCIRQGINEARDGRSLNQLSYQELKRELAAYKIRKAEIGECDRGEIPYYYQLGRK